MCFCKINQKLGKTDNLHARTKFLKRISCHQNALIKAKHRIFRAISSNRDDDFIEKFQPSSDNINMPICNRIESARIYAIIFQISPFIFLVILDAIVLFLVAFSCAFLLKFVEHFLNIISLFSKFCVLKLLLCLSCFCILNSPILSV